MFDASLFDVDRIRQRLAERRSESEFEARLRTGTLLLAGTFAFSALANFFLTRWVVTSPSGSEAFNQELGRLTLLSYPVIAIPSMLMMMALMWWLAQSASRLTGLTLAELFGPEPAPPPSGSGQPLTEWNGGHPRWSVSNCHGDALEVPGPICASDGSRVLIVDQGSGNCRGLPCAMSSSMRAMTSRPLGE